MPEVKRKITNADPITGKKMVAFLTNAPLGWNGNPNKVQYLVKYKEADENTDAIPPDNTLSTRRAIREEEVTFVINERKISSVTRLYLPENTGDPDAITLEQYFATKIINTFPGVGAGDQFWKMAEGILREVIEIQWANGEMPPLNP